MTLSDLENEVLAMMQQPALNFGGAPNFAALTNPQYNQATIDHYINRGYARLLSDLADTEIVEYTATFLSTALTNFYPLNPPASYLGSKPPAVRILNRVSYQPLGLPYAVEFEAGSRLVDHGEFSRYSGQGYLIPYSYSATVPDIVSISPDRKLLEFFPGSGQTGDIITIKYAPMWTAASDVGPLVAGTDVPYFPEDCHDAIVFYALSQLWIKAREMATAQYYRQQYDAETARLITQYQRRSRGDRLTISSVNEERATRFWPT